MDSDQESARAREARSREDPMDDSSTSIREVRRLVLAVLEVGKVMQTQLAGDLESSLGISLGEFDVLDILDAAPKGRLSMSEISDRLLISNVETRRLVESLAKRGLVSEAGFVTITSDGRDMKIEVIPILYFSLKYHFGSHLDEDDVASVTAGLEGILRDLGAGEADFVRRWNPPSSTAAGDEVHDSFTERRQS
jgi:DNA-binding MarR family transcriptional regulator